MQPEVLVQDAGATATSNPTYNYYLSSVYHSHRHTYFVLHRCVPPPPAEQAWQWVHACRSVVNISGTVELKITSRLRLHTLLFSRYPKVQCIGIGLRVVED